jgi:hypothetical protein
MNKTQIDMLARALQLAHSIQREAMAAGEWAQVCAIQDKITQAAELLGCSPYAGEK